jgi:hypothetical protein
MRLIKTVLASALVVTAMPFAAVASRPAPDLATIRTEHAAQRARLVRGLPVDPAIATAGSKPSPVYSWDEAYLTRAGDLDRDGLEDLVDVRYHVVIDDAKGWSEAVTLEAHKGTDGTKLWTASVPAAEYVLPLFTKVGVDAKPGVLVVAYDGTDVESDVGGGYELDLTAMAISGLTGTPLWATKGPGIAAWSSVAGAYAGATYAEGFFDAAPGDATDVLLTTASEGELPTGYTGAVVQAGVLDGATGTYRPAGAPTRRDEWDYSFATTADLDADGYDDILTRTNPGVGALLTAVSSVDGTTIWTSTGLPIGSDWWDLDTPGDVTGDGVPDVVATVSGYDDPDYSEGRASASLAKPGGPTVILVNGATGKTAWTKRGTYAAALGDADRKKGIELLVGESLYGSKTGFTAGAYTGSGRRLWSVTRTLPASDEMMMRPSWAVTGDVNADGVADVGYRTVVQRHGKATRRDEGTVDGRTGKVRRDPAPDLYGLRVAVDGRGADTYAETLSRGLLTVTTYAGDTGRKLWTVSVAAVGYYASESTAAPLDKDKCAEIVVSVADGDATYTDYVLAGSTGKPMWSLKRTGTAAGTVAKPAAKKQKQYVRSC